MRIVAIIFGILAAIVDLILVIVSIAVPEVSLWGWIVVLTIVTVGLFFSANKVKKQKESQTGGTSGQKHAVHGRNRDFSDRTGRTSCCNRGRRFFWKKAKSPIITRRRRRLSRRTRAVGRTGSGAGVRVRVAKGVSVSTGGGSSRTVYGEVTETYSGAIVLTNRRIVFIHNQDGFECKISALTAVTPVDGSVVVQAGSKTYQFSAARQDLFVSALSMVTGK